MQQKTDVFEQVEGPRSGRALVHLLLVLGLMRVDAFKDTQSPENQGEIRIFLSVSWLPFGCVLPARNPDLEPILNNVMCLGVGLDFVICNAKTMKINLEQF